MREPISVIKGVDDIAALVAAQTPTRPSGYLASYSLGISGLIVSVACVSASGCGSVDVEVKDWVEAGFVVMPVETDPSGFVITVVDVDAGVLDV